MNMNRTKLTAGRIRDFTTDTGQAFLWDTEAPGLAVRATAKGAQAFIYQGKLNGKALRLTIGDCRAWGIDAARQESRRLRTLVDQGIDPREVKRERIAAHEARQEEARRQGMTVGEAWASYLEARRQKWSPRSYQDHVKLAQPGGQPKTRGRKRGEGTTTMPGPLAALMPLPLAELTGRTIEAWLKTETAHRPTQARNAFVRLRAFINWLSEQEATAGIVDRVACNTRRIKEVLPEARAKEDSLQREQLRPWFEAVRRIKNPVHAAYLQGLLLTGARREEWAGLRWQDVDFQWKSLTIHDKVEGERTIPLTPYLAGLLALLPRRNEWVFSSPTAASGRLQEPRIAHNKALTAAGLPALTLHGLRRSFGTLAEWIEAPTGVVAQVQGNKPSAIAEKHYRRRPLDLLRMWHSRIEAWILAEAGIQQPEEEAQGLRLVTNNVATNSKMAIS
jgi:integrase